MATLTEIAEISTQAGWPALIKKIEGAVVVKASAIVDEAATPEYTEWKASTVVAVNDYIYVGTHLYRCVTAGTTGATIPAVFPAVAHGTVEDNAAKWEFYRAPEDGLLAWARATIERPARSANNLASHLVGTNSGFSVAAILAAGDSAVQSNVDDAVDALYSAISVAPPVE